MPAATKPVPAPLPPVEDDEAIDVATAAKLARVTPKTIRSKIHKGRLPAMELGGKMWVSRADVQREFTPRPYVPKGESAPALSPETTPERWDRLKALLGGAYA